MFAGSSRFLCIDIACVYMPCKDLKVFFCKKNALQDAIQPDAPISFTQLANVLTVGGGEDVFELSLSQALGQGQNKEKPFDFASSKLGKVTQLTGGLYLFFYVHLCGDCLELPL